MNDQINEGILSLEKSEWNQNQVKKFLSVVSPDDLKEAVFCQLKLFSLLSTTEIEYSDLFPTDGHYKAYIHLLHEMHKVLDN